MTNTQSQEDKAIDVFKKWHISGFINIQYWQRTNRVVVDIGTVSGNKLISSAKCYIKASQFLAYLKADVEKNLSHVYPKFFEEKTGGITWYGGTTQGGQPVARVFKIVAWHNDPQSRAFKCGWFEGKVEGKGAITPNWSKELRREQIKMSIAEIAELYENLKLVMIVENVQKSVEETVFEDDNIILDQYDG